jgi:hypothetical protein
MTTFKSWIWDFYTPEDITTPLLPSTDTGLTLHRYTAYLAL